LTWILCRCMGHELAIACRGIESQVSQILIGSGLGLARMITWSVWSWSLIEGSLFCVVAIALLSVSRMTQKLMGGFSWNLPSVLWCGWLGDRKGIWPVKNWVVGCWRGYLSGARCRLAYGPANATATHYLLLQYNLYWFYLSDPAHPDVSQVRIYGLGLAHVFASNNTMVVVCTSHFTECSLVRFVVGISAAFSSFKAVYFLV